MNTPLDTSLQSNAKTNARSAAENAHLGIDRTAEALHDTTESAAAAATRLAEKAERGAESVRATEQQAREKLLDYSSQHPLRTLAMCFGAGFILAKLTGKR